MVNLSSPMGVYVLCGGYDASDSLVPPSSLTCGNFSCRGIQVLRPTSPASGLVYMRPASMAKEPP